MQKDKTIIDFLNKLKLLANFNDVEIIDYWESDLSAVGLKRGNKLIYINTIAHPAFDYDLELLNPQNIEELNVIKEVRGVSEDVVINEIKEFLFI